MLAHAGVGKPVGAAVRNAAPYAADSGNEKLSVHLLLQRPHALPVITVPLATPSRVQPHVRGLHRALRQTNAHCATNKHARIHAAARLLARRQNNAST